MSWIIGFLTFVLVVDCLFLMLLVLVQLPKKEAGMGQAFGGAATDALFGAGSGTALTNMTKYATGVFFILTLSISILYAHQTRNRQGASKLQQSMQQLGQVPVPPAVPTINTGSPPSAAVATGTVASATSAATAVVTQSLTLTNPLLSTSTGTVTKPVTNLPAAPK